MKGLLEGVWWLVTVANVPGFERALKHLEKSPSGFTTQAFPEMTSIVNQ